jgi:hypothetical protein
MRFPNWFSQLSGKTKHDATETSSTDTTRLRRNYASAESAATLPRIDELRVGVEAPSAEWAIIVQHGMGQQVHFETLEAIALAIRSAEIRVRKDAEPIRTRVVKMTTLDGRPIELVRAEMTVTGTDDRPHNVHVYESYWAPLTQGRVTLRDVLRFVGEGAWKGFGYLISHWGNFDRWAFGKMRKFPIRVWLTALKLAFALFILAPPVVLATFLAATQTVHLVFSALGGLPYKTVNAGSSHS